MHPIIKVLITKGELTDTFAMSSLMVLNLY